MYIRNDGHIDRLLNNLQKPLPDNLTSMAFHTHKFQMATDINKMWYIHTIR